MIDEKSLFESLVGWGEKLSKSTALNAREIFSLVGSNQKTEEI